MQRRLKMSQKDPKRYSYSRFKTHQICPKKEDYEYKQLIEPEDSEPLLLGKIFHSLIETITTKADRTPLLKQYEFYCSTGKITKPVDLMRYMIELYEEYYYYEDINEQVIAVEKEIEMKLDKGDYFVMRLDKLIEKKDSGLVYLRDTKTTSGNLSSTLDDAISNQQLLLYIPFAEPYFKLKIDVVELDEVRFAFLEDVPMNKNGMPSADRKRLGLVTYEAYYNKLCEMDLQEDPLYLRTLDWLESRGHPLFKRVAHQIVDRNIINANLIDMQGVLSSIRQGNVYRNPGWQCNHCPFKKLCDLDKFFPDERDREIIIGSIKRKS